MSTFTSSEGFMPYFCWTTMLGWICSKLLRKECFLQKLKHVLIGYRYAITGPNLIYFDNPQNFPFVANHSALALSTPSPSPSNIYAYSVNKMTTKNDLVLYLHQAEWRPVPSTLIKAIYACFYGIW